MTVRILVVDDDASQCRCMGIGLRVEGFEVWEVANGDAALAALDQTSFDAAVVDLMMPGMSGLELCRVMRQRHPEIPVVLTSAYHLSDRQLELAGIGHAIFLGKPFSVEALARMVREQLARALPETPAANGS